MKLLEKGPAPVTTRRLRSLFFKCLAEVAPDVLRELDQLRRRLRSRDMDSNRPRSLAYLVMVSGFVGDDSEFDAPTYMKRWASHHHIAWPWVQREAACWLYFAKLGKAPTSENGLPYLTGGAYVWTERELRVPVGVGAPHQLRWSGSTIQRPPAPFLVQGVWRGWIEPWTQFRERMMSECQRQLDAYGKHVREEALRGGAALVTEKHRASSHHMRWLVQWQVCGMSAEQIAEVFDREGEDACTDPGSVRKELRKLAERLGVSLRPAPTG